jgi:hypothetical protein
MEMVDYAELGQLFCRHYDGLYCPCVEGYWAWGYTIDDVEPLTPAAKEFLAIAKAGAQ